jgi:hypothetical protein
MVIYTVCVDRENGRCLAVSCDDPDQQEIGSNYEEAVGAFIIKRPGIKVDNVCILEPKL